MHVCMRVCAYTCMCACIWRSWVNLRCHSLGVIILISEKGFHQFGLVGQSMSSKEQFVSISPSLCLIVYLTIFGSLTWVLKIELRSPACVETEHLPNPKKQSLLDMITPEDYLSSK